MFTLLILVLVLRNKLEFVFCFLVGVFGSSPNFIGSSVLVFFIETVRLTAQLPLNFGLMIYLIRCWIVSLSSSF
jgi:hypothetical protein